MSVNWQNPYEGSSGFSIKGNLHTHTSYSACGRIALDAVIRLYEKLGYGFLSITDHCIQTDVSAFKSRPMTVLPGMEIDIKGQYHFGVVNIDASAIYYDPEASQQQLIDRNIAAGALVILNHPDWQLREHYTMDELLALANYDGIEIYNRN